MCEQIGDPGQVARVRSTARWCASSRPARSPTKRCSKNVATRCSRRCAAKATSFGLAWLELSSGRFSVLEAGRQRKRWPASWNACGRRSCWLPSSRPPCRARSPQACASGHRGISTSTPRRARCASSSGRAICRASAAPHCLWRSQPRAACLQYVRDTQKAALPHLQGLRTKIAVEAVLLDAATRRNLELDTSPGRSARLHARRRARSNRHRDGRARTAPLDASTAARPAHGRAALAGHRHADRQRGCTSSCMNCCAHVGDIERGPRSRGTEVRASARPGATARCARRVCRSCRRCSLHQDSPLLQSWPREPARIRMSHALLTRALSTHRRPSCARAASSPPATTPSSTSCGASASTAINTCSTSKRASANAPALPI